MSNYGNETDVGHLLMKSSHGITLLKLVQTFGLPCSDAPCRTASAALVSLGLHGAVNSIMGKSTADRGRFEEPRNPSPHIYFQLQSSRSVKSSVVSDVLTVNPFTSVRLKTCWNSTAQQYLLIQNYSARKIVIILQSCGLWEREETGRRRSMTKVINIVSTVPDPSTMKRVTNLIE